MTSENQFLLHALYMGIYITFVYDLLRIFRRVIPHGQFMVSFEDILFWIYCAVEVFLLMHHESNGTLRWFAVLGALVGMLLYRRLASPYLVKYASLFLQKIVKVVVKFGSIILRPFTSITKKLASTAKETGRKAKNRGGGLKRRLKKRLTFFLKVLKMNL